MIWFWSIAGLLVVVALTALLRPLMRTRQGTTDRGETVVALFRQELASIDAEIAQGRLAPTEAETARAEITRRMLTATDQQGALAEPAAETSWRIGAAVGIASLLPAAGLAIYLAVGAPAAINQTAASETVGGAGPHDRTELAAAADQLKARLEREPGHIEGWILLGRTFTSLQRFAEAREAYRRAVALAPNEPALHAEFGELLVLATSGEVTPEAAAEFAQAGDDPRARFYGAEAALQRGDRAAAKAALSALLAEAPAEAPWRALVAERLAQIAPGEQPSSAKRAEPSPSPGPTAQDVAAADAMSPQERQAMVRSMVDRLAARLEQNPSDKEGWTRLAHAYDVLGETEKAKAARTRAAQVPATGK
jgi:cytochrome c-type biogenesis protein CcmH